ncbi:MAG: cytochrome P450 [Shouchella clausii]
MSKCPMRFNEDDHAWIIEGLEESKYILESQYFRKPKQNEFEHGTLMSPSFFLALELTPEEEHERIRKEFAKSFSNNRMKRIEKEILEPNVTLFLDSMTDINVTSIEKNFLELYCDKAFKEIVGLNKEFSKEILAIYKVCDNFFKKDGPKSLHGRAGYRLMYSKLIDYCKKYKKNEEQLSFIGYMVNNDEVRIEEIVYYVIPFLEMISLKIHIELPLELIKHLSKLPTDIREDFIKNRKNLNLAIEEAARLMKPNRAEGPYITRVPIQDIKVNNQLVLEGERVVLKIVESGLDERTFKDANDYNPWRENLNLHLAFGAGLHRCLGKNLAKSVAACAATQLFIKYPNINISS